MTGLITTGDGTATLFLDEYDQAMHSTSGAYEEALLKHVEPSRVLEKKKEHLRVLDVGFGLGYNVLALIDRFISASDHTHMNIISLEKDRSFVQYMENIKFHDYRDNIYKRIKECYSLGCLKFDNVSLNIIFGDARESLKKLNDMEFDAIFQDPFSPAKNPELWSVEYFKLLSSYMADDCILTTYSSADHIRKAMIDAGLCVGQGPSVGQKREGTLASRTGIIKILDKQKISEIMNNLKSEPYRDQLLDLSREIIISNRLDTIRRKKTTKYHQAHQE